MGVGGALRNTGTGVLLNTNTSSNVLQYVSVPHSPAFQLSAASIQVWPSLFSYKCYIFLCRAEKKSTWRFLAVCRT